MHMKQIFKSVIPKFLWNRLRVLRIRYTLAGYQPRRVRHRYGTFDLKIQLVDPMGEGWYDSTTAMNRWRSRF